MFDRNMLIITQPTTQLEIFCKYMFYFQIVPYVPIAISLIHEGKEGAKV